MFRDRAALLLNNLVKSISIPFNYSAISSDIFLINNLVDFFKLVAVIYTSFITASFDPLLLSRKFFNNFNKFPSFTSVYLKSFVYKIECYAPLGYVRH